MLHRGLFCPSHRGHHPFPSPPDVQRGKLLMSCHPHVTTAPLAQSSSSSSSPLHASRQGPSCGPFTRTGQQATPGFIIIMDAGPLAQHSSSRKQPQPPCVHSSRSLQDSSSSNQAGCLHTAPGAIPLRGARPGLRASGARSAEPLSAAAAAAARGASRPSQRAFPTG